MLKYQQSVFCLIYFRIIFRVVWPRLDDSKETVWFEEMNEDCELRAGNCNGAVPARHIPLKRKENSEVMKETLSPQLLVLLNPRESIVHHFLQIYFIRSCVSFKTFFDLIHVVHGDGGEGEKIKMYLKSFVLK